MTEDDYALLSNRENYIEYIVEESTNSSRIYDCHLAENTKTRKTYVSRTFNDVEGNAAYILIHVYSNRTWYKTETSYSCFLEPTEADNGKVLEVVNGNPVWTEKSVTSAARQYVTLRGGSEGVLGEDELSILRNDENGIEYVIEESTNSSRIYRCHLSENTKTRKTYVSRTFTGQNGSASYILIYVDLAGTWYKTERTYKGFLTPTAADSGKVLTVHANGTPIWSNPVNSYTLTPTDKSDIAEMVNGATIVQAPKYVNSVSEMTDTSRLYVLKSTGRIYAFMNTTTEQEVTVREDIVATADNGYTDQARFTSSNTT
ncbi:MAG: hypothetical protein J6S34_05050, partial [Clostridia bacterium]|nr:hypothetical protein [Clostridia bacterium]